MDQATTVTGAGAPAHEYSHAAPRIYYIHPLLAGPLAGWDAHLDRAAAMGFTHMLTAPIFAARSLLVPADFDRPHPALAWHGDANSALRHIAESCAARGLSALMDVNPARVAADGPLAAERHDLFCAPDRSRALDPRRFDVAADAAPSRWDEAGDAVVAFWADRMVAWREAGIDGFRILLADMPPEYARTIISRGRVDADTLLLGWTPGLPRESLDALRGCGLDFVFSSLPWWDFRADWLWRESEVLARIAPAIAAVEAPFGSRLAATLSELDLVLAAQRRLVRFAASFGDGWLMPMGFEDGATRAMDPRRDRPQSFPLDGPLAAEIAIANHGTAHGLVRLLSGPGADVIAMLRSDADPRFATSASLHLLNVDLEQRQRIPLAPLVAAAGGRFGAPEFESETSLTLGPVELHVIKMTPSPPTILQRPVLGQSARTAANAPRVAIERVTPAVDDGRFAAKRLVGDVVAVEADILCDGHDQLAACVRWRVAGNADWREVRMRPAGNDRWTAAFPLTQIGRYEFTVEAWRDAFATFRDELRKKYEAGIDVRVELIEGRRLIAEAGAPLAAIARRMADADITGEIAMLLSAETGSLMAAADPRPRAVRTNGTYPIDADRIAAEFASWYEIFPRSMSDDPDRHGTFDDVIRHLPRIRDMGFDVLYFPPIHPIGRANRKGRNNTLTPAPDDPGSPYAIGGAEGGHDAIHPQLGTLEDFQRLRAAAEAHGLEVALDFAIQCSPDHPWLKQHPKWFAWRPDGSIRYAENPPKKYEDIVNVDFYADGAIPDLWVALAEVVIFWAEQGVRIFRVDNPHTKPFPFWEWMIGEVRARFPDAIFLAEAFTRPKLMGRLGKIGFTQSYTYFTWRNTKRELQEYLAELSTAPMRDCFRPNFFVNTPDINPVFLQTGGRAGHLIRAALAATLSGSWGVYSGFELCESTPLPGREEYMDSEKYQVRAWDWQRAGNIVADIQRLNMVRRENPALRTHIGVSFLPADNDQIMFYEKATPDRTNVVLIAVSLDPIATQSAAVELPLYRWGLADEAAIAASDLVNDREFTWTGKWQRITLSPDAPFGIWRVRASAEALR